MSQVKHFAANEAGRDFVVGDLHGCREMFDQLLTAIEFDQTTDRMFSVGDLIDRGPDSLGCLALLQEHWFHAVRGNHEDILLTIQAQGTHDNWHWWIQNGGAWARGLTKEELAEHAANIQALPLVISVGEGKDRFNVIHAEFFGDEATLDAGDFHERTRQQLMWGRQLIGETDPARIRHISRLSITFCGHSIVPDICKIGSQIYIDTGAFISHWSEGADSGALTVIEPKTNSVWRK
jgi:serine/threonine protein phosphatase 1